MIDVEKMIQKKYPKLQDNKIIKSAISKFADAIVHETYINNFLKENAHLGAFEFIENALDELEFTYQISEKYLQNIPSTGRVVIIANHPLGALDALSLVKLVSTIRKDVKIVANDFLSSLSPLKPILLDINNFKTKQVKSSIGKIYDALNNEEAVIIFPSGEVSRATPRGVKDKNWHKGFLKFAQRSSSPILPVYIGGKNSKTFYSVSALNKKLSMLLLSHEMFKQKGNSIEIIVGEIIPFENILPKGIRTDKLLNLYQKHLYGLKKGEKFFSTQKAIALAEDRRYLKQELKDSQLLGLTKDNKKIYLYEWSSNNSSILNEIGRLREISFRKVGEGVNKKRDIDKYDRYYKHIILWDEEALEIVGAYRIGECKDIIDKYSQNALYTTTLFEYNDSLSTYLNEAIELGRSFVQPKYWGSRALDYLWQGIGAYLKNNPEIKYMYGPVSLSGAYPKIAKDMIIYFYNHYFYDNEHLVDAKSSSKLNLKDEYVQKFLSQLQGEDYSADFKLLKRALGYLDLNVPTLYKQYADLCEEGGIRFCAYNIDKDFSDCVDSFILVDINKIKEKQHKRYFGE